MTDKELKRLSRTELIQLLLDVTKENDALRAENKELREGFKDRKLILNSVGNIAEASLIINKVFQDAQEAADQYLENVKRVYKERAEQQFKKVLQKLNGTEQEVALRYKKEEQTGRQKPITSGELMKALRRAEQSDEKNKPGGTFGNGE